MGSERQPQHRDGDHHVVQVKIVYAGTELLASS
jgi:hypothetical protein